MVAVDFPSELPNTELPGVCVGGAWMQQVLIWLLQNLHVFKIHFEAFLESKITKTERWKQEK